MKTFKQWAETHHPKDVDAAWFVMNCLCDVIGWETQDCKDAVEWWQMHKKPK